MNTENILTIKENPYYEYKKHLNKNQKVLKALNISIQELSKFSLRSRQAIEKDFRSPENMHKTMYDRSMKRWIFYARKISKMTGKNIDENIFL